MSLPPPNVTRTVVQRFARCQSRYRNELKTRPLVLPTAEFFPDPYEQDEISAELLVIRLQELAGLSDIPLKSRVLSNRPSRTPSGCSSGGCAVPQSGPQQFSRLLDEADGWVVQIPREELAHPIALTTNLVRSLAYIFLVETQLDGEVIEPPVDITADIVAVALGFGPLLLQGSYLYAKSCGGPQVASLTKLTVNEIAIATALFSQLHELPVKKAYPLLEVTQKSALKAAVELLASNPRIEKALHHDEGMKSLVQGRFELNERKSLLSRLWNRRKDGDLDHQFDDLDPSMALEEIEALMLDMPPSSRAGRQHSFLPEESPSAEEPLRQHDDDLRNLVAESIQESKLASSVRRTH